MRKGTFILIFIFGTLISVFAQYPPTPPEPPKPTVGSNTGTTGNSLNGPMGAPIGDGLSILLMLAGCYAGKRVFEWRRINKKQPQY